jgi:flagellar basal-body rod protein FlgB
MSDMGIAPGGGLYSGESIPVIEAVLSYANQRHVLLLNNVANVDTPGFRAKDLPEEAFRRALVNAIENRETGARPLEFTSGQDVRRTAGGGIEVVPVQNGHGVMRHDGNNVSIDEEMTKLLKNGLTVQVFNRLLAGKFQALVTAIRMRV